MMKTTMGRDGQQEEEDGRAEGGTYCGEGREWRVHKAGQRVAGGFSIVVG
jgi:hypothetical protein